MNLCFFLSILLLLSWEEEIKKLSHVSSLLMLYIRKVITNDAKKVGTR